VAELLLRCPPGKFTRKSPTDGIDLFPASPAPAGRRRGADKQECGNGTARCPLPLGEPSATMKGQTKEELAKALADNFLPTDQLILEQNALVLNTGNKLVLFDTGMGTAKPFGPTPGRLLKSLEEGKIPPAAIDDIICSHGHIDHIGGLADDKGKRYFPNATVWITKADYDFWTKS
jgi:hypothetical protein